MAKVKILTAAEAANLVEDGMTVSTNGFVACDLARRINFCVRKTIFRNRFPKKSDLLLCCWTGKS